jgi:hypothetical protein
MTDRFVARTRALFVVLLAVSAFGCRGVHDVSHLKSATAPHISKLFLGNGKTVVFNADLGWYDVKDSLIEGVTVDSQHVSIPLAEVRNVETVREYSVAFFYIPVLAAMGVATYLLFRLFSLF